jgi:hypothetical protein
MAQVISITSESLQAKIRELLPSQQGFGEDLQASNVILPIIDITGAAEGSSVGENLQTAWDFTTGHTTINNTTSTLVSNTGFWRISLVYKEGNVLNNTVTPLANVFLDDGATTKTIWQLSTVNSGSANEDISTRADFVVFLRSGDTLKGFTYAARATLDVSYRQIADVNGTLVNPLGFSPQ